MEWTKGIRQLAKMWAGRSGFNAALPGRITTHPFHASHGRVVWAEAEFRKDNHYQIKFVTWDTSIQERAISDAPNLEAAIAAFGETKPFIKTLLSDYDVLKMSAVQAYLRIKDIEERWQDKHSGLTQFSANDHAPSIYSAKSHHEEHAHLFPNDAKIEPAAVRAFDLLYVSGRAWKKDGMFPDEHTLRGLEGPNKKAPYLTLVSDNGKIKPQQPA